MRAGGAARVGATLIFLVLVAASATIVASVSSQSFYPKHWDARVAPIAAEVEQLRGLTYKHPVPVHFLSDKQFEKEINGGDSGQSGIDTVEAARTTKVFRALGLIDGHVDLAKAVTTSHTSGTLAAYSFDRKDIIVRGTTLDPSHRVTLAHELTHVLQDQYFNINDISKRADRSTSGTYDAMLAIIEGDAVRIQNKYLAKLSAADKKSYDEEQRAQGTRIDKETKDVPDVVTLSFEAPYTFGPSTLDVLEASGGNDAINAAFRGPIPNSALYIEPADLAAPPTVAVPRVPAGAKQDGPPEVISAFEMYVAIGSRLDALEALQAADAITSGRAVTYTRGSKTCYRVALATPHASETSFVRHVLSDWAAVLPNITLDPVRTVAGFTACDPGTSATSPSHARFDALESLLGNRSELTVVAARGHLEPPLARCVAREFFLQRGAQQLVDAVGNNEPTAAQQSALTSDAMISRQSCELDLDAGLP